MNQVNSRFIVISTKPTTVVSVTRRTTPQVPSLVPGAFRRRQAWDRPQQQYSWGNCSRRGLSDGRCTGGNVYDRRDNPQSHWPPPVAEVSGGSACCVRCFERSEPSVRPHLRSGRISRWICRRFPGPAGWFVARFVRWCGCWLRIRRLTPRIHHLLLMAPQRARYRRLGLVTGKTYVTAALCAG